LADFGRDQYLYLTTRGRRTGQAREIEIWFTRRDNCFYVIAEYDTSNWIQNVQAHAEVQFRIGGQTFAGRARVLSTAVDGDLLRAIQELSRKKYGWGEGTVVELCPDAQGQKSETEKL
jgi:deazaflavin-dependent oxidoreductase (nitroreductase family)